MTESSKEGYGNYKSLRKLSDLDFDFIRFCLFSNLCVRIFGNVSVWMDSINALSHFYYNTAFRVLSLGIQ